MAKKEKEVIEKDEKEQKHPNPIKQKMREEYLAGHPDEK
jgi:hypothetical protein